MNRRCEFNSPAKTLKNLKSLARLAAQWPKLAAQFNLNHRLLTTRVYTGRQS